MIGTLPGSLEIGGEFYAINADFRTALTIFEAFDDPELDEREKALAALMCLFEDWNEIPPEMHEEAVKQAFWFLNGGDMPKTVSDVKLIDWEQDERLIFPAVNRAAGCEVRAVGYMHWWTFLGYFSVIGEGLFSEIIHIRRKRAQGKPLDKTESEFLRSHRELIDFKKRLTAEQMQAEAEDEAFLKELLGE